MLEEEVEFKKYRCPNCGKIESYVVPYLLIFPDEYDIQCIIDDSYFIRTCPHCGHRLMLANNMHIFGLKGCNYYLHTSSNYISEQEKKKVESVTNMELEYLFSIHDLQVIAACALLYYDEEVIKIYESALRMNLENNNRPNRYDVRFKVKDKEGYFLIHDLTHNKAYTTPFDSYKYYNLRDEYDEELGICRVHYSLI